MTSRIDWNWTQNIVSFGRLLGAAIIVLGVLLAAWNATDVNEAARLGSYAALRGFIQESLLYIWYGGLVLIVAEIVGAVGGNDLALGQINWNVPDLTRVIAAIILVAGTVVIVWDIYAMRDGVSAFLGVGSFTQGELSISESIRYFLQLELRQYLWHAGLLVLLAALADRIRWRAEGTLLEEEENASVDVEP
jgi:hypothetical protein